MSISAHPTDSRETGETPHEARKRARDEELAAADSDFVDPADGATVNNNRYQLLRRAIATIDVPRMAHSSVDGCGSASRRMMLSLKSPLDRAAIRTMGAQSATRCSPQQAAHFSADDEEHEMRRASDAAEKDHASSSPVDCRSVSSRPVMHPSYFKAYLRALPRASRGPLWHQPLEGRRIAPTCPDALRASHLLDECVASGNDLVVDEGDSSPDFRFIVWEEARRRAFHYDHVGGSLRVVPPLGVSVAQLQLVCEAFCFCETLWGVPRSDTVALLWRFLRANLRLPSHITTCGAESRIIRIAGGILVLLQMPLWPALADIATNRLFGAPEAGNVAHRMCWDAMVLKRTPPDSVRDFVMLANSPKRLSG